MKAKLFFLMAVPFFLTSCAMQSKNPDLQVDSRLGVEVQDDNQRAQEAIQDLQKTQQQEQRRQLERQISDPLAGS